MTVVEFFDENNVEHIRAYQFLCKFGKWPKEYQALYEQYLIPNVEAQGDFFPMGWQFEIAQILANAYVSNFMYFHTAPETIEYEYKKLY